MGNKIIKQIHIEYQVNIKFNIIQLPVGILFHMIGQSHSTGI